MDFLGKKIHRKLGAWPCDGELAWCAYGPGSHRKQGRKEGRDGERNKGKGKDWEDRRRKISGENRAWARFRAMRLKPQHLGVGSRRIKASYRRPCLKNKEVGVALRSSVAGASQTWFLNKNCRGMGSEVDSQNLLALMAEIYETLSEKPRAQQPALVFLWVTILSHSLLRYICWRKERSMS